MYPFIKDNGHKFIEPMIKCKQLGRLIKTRRNPAWPVLVMSDLPSKAIADELVERYFRTSESFYRILHIPTFKRDYEALWTSGTEPDTAFLVQLKLVMAIGSVTYDEDFSLRTSALQWVYEGHAWVSEPIFKPRLTIQYLQTNLLLLVARETVAVGEEMVWVSTGNLLRLALHMGLHRDPKHLPKRSSFAAEMRRRLWNTIIELTIQSSMLSAGPVLLSTSDFDTEPPGNYDDEQLTAEDAVVKAEGEYTQMSIALALRKTLPVRLDVVKSLNDVSPNVSYEETLRLDKRIREAYKELKSTIQRLRSSTGRTPSDFERRILDVLMSRYLLSIHIPFFVLAINETAYAFTRIVVLETSLKVWRTVHPIPTSQMLQNGPLVRDDVARFCSYGSGFFPTFSFQACLMIAAELRSQLREDDGLGSFQPRPDLLAILEDVRIWTYRCLETGETNVMGVLFQNLIGTSIDAAMKGLPEEDLPPLYMETAGKWLTKCAEVLEGTAAKYENRVSLDDLGQMPMNFGLEAQMDWDFMVRGNRVETLELVTDCVRIRVVL
jgi:hypothetical protein